MPAQRETGEAIRMAHTALRRNASKKALRLKPETLERANFVILFTTFPATPFSAADMREWYRSRGWVEVAFERFKYLAQLAHLPRDDDDCATAWLHGKLLAACLSKG